MILSFVLRFYGQVNTIKVMPTHIAEKRLTSTIASN